MRLSDADLSKRVNGDTYKSRREAADHELIALQQQCAQRRIAVALVFEGWDASGKGGCIQRLVEHFDPRLYRVHGIAKPTEEEHGYHYLWRFWNRLPKYGRWAIFDRSWYGRVLVERVEGFAEKEEWKRAYGEINRFEGDLVADGMIIIKFFLHISKKEQKHRFEERLKDPLRAWKMCEEDWRNRKKWEQYEAAIDDMLARTHTPAAPWHLIAAEDKRYARITVLETVIRQLRKRLSQGHD